MKILVAILAKSKNDPLLVEGLHYLERMRSPLSANAILLPPKSNISEAQKDIRMTSEGVLLLEKTERHFRIALDEKGKQFSSEQLLKLLETLMQSNKKPAFLIGGAFGLSKEVLHKSDQIMSLSSMTMPHRMAFLLLCEQLYRASEMLNNSPYHK